MAVLRKTGIDPEVLPNSFLFKGYLLFFALALAYFIHRQLKRKWHSMDTFHNLYITTISLLFGMAVTLVPRILRDDIPREATVAVNAVILILVLLSLVKPIRFVKKSLMAYGPWRGTVYAFVMLGFGVTGALMAATRPLRSIPYILLFTGIALWATASAENPGKPLFHGILLPEDDEDCN